MICTKSFKVPYQRYLVTSPLDSVHQDLVGGQNIMPEDCKCAGEHPNSPVKCTRHYPTVAPEVSKQIPMKSYVFAYSGFR